MTVNIVLGLGGRARLNIMSHRYIHRVFPLNAVTIACTGVLDKGLPSVKCGLGYTH